MKVNADELLLPVEISIVLDVPMGTIYSLIKSRDFPAPILFKRTGKGGIRMWRKSDVLVWRKANKASPYHPRYGR